MVFGMIPTKSLTAYSTQPFQVTGVSRADCAIKCTADSEIMYGNYAAAPIQIGDDGCRGQASSGNDEDDLGLAPSRPDHLSGLLTSSLGTMLAGWDSIQLTGANINGFQGQLLLKVALCMVTYTNGQFLEVTHIHFIYIYITCKWLVDVIVLLNQASSTTRSLRVVAAQFVSRW